MKKILITGGAGDWAKSFTQHHGADYDIVTCGRNELDVSSIESVQAFFANRKFDIVINNAGSIHPKRVVEADAQKWINDINVNLIGTFLVSKAALEKNERTTIINISSTAGFNAYNNWSSYCSAKAGVITFSKCLANDNYESYCVCPGAIDTKFRDGLNLSNANAMTSEHLSSYIVDILDGKYHSGDVLFIRKDEFVLNP
ncbi:SDR family oxidoreductase [Glaciecola sp. MH2013]|uniref:SDR family NAD(P)-dependent oxidoreductase n=1 Tax=Glaciecola sp. MH2013 TaxID=2785524 RepID=UPI00189E1FFB|nr:SDR family oxidoreductase [Glaciecola sp. MH2013]MBF7073106.1 SDR family oxidoreductase [Glaciecola sp. MH2013]